MARRTSKQVIEDNQLKAEIKTALNSDPRAVMKAILILASYQTQTELELQAATAENGLGFSKVDASYGCFLAERIRENKLSKKGLDDARRISLKYANTQLSRPAKEKRERKASGNCNG